MKGCGENTADIEGHVRSPLPVIPRSVRPYPAVVARQGPERAPGQRPSCHPGHYQRHPQQAGIVRHATRKRPAQDSPRPLHAPERCGCCRPHLRGLGRGGPSGRQPIIDAVLPKAHRTSAYLRRGGFPYAAFGHTGGVPDPKSHAVGDDDGRSLIPLPTEGATTTEGPGPVQCPAGCRCTKADKNHDGDRLRKVPAGRGTISGIRQADRRTTVAYDDSPAGSAT